MLLSEHGRTKPIPSEVNFYWLREGLHSQAHSSRLDSKDFQRGKVECFQNQILIIVNIQIPSLITDSAMIIDLNSTEFVQLYPHDVAHRQHFERPDESWVTLRDLYRAWLTISRFPRAGPLP